MHFGLGVGCRNLVFSLSHNDVQRLKQRSSASAAAVLRLLGDVDMLLATILVANNLVNICITILTASIVDAVFTFSHLEFLFKTVVVTFLLLLFGEVLPKVLAQTTPMRFAQFVAQPLIVLRWVLYPLSFILVRTSSRISEKAAHKSEISLDELADAVDMTQASNPEEHVMLSGIVNFVNTEVQEIMKPRVDITALELTDDYEKVKRTIIASGFSRIPVFEEDIDNIRGTLYVKDLLPYINHGNEFGWQQLIRKPYFVPEHKKINDLLGDFQTNKVHMAIVVDEYGRRSAWCRWKTSSKRSSARFPTRATTTRASTRGSMPRATCSTARPISAISSAFSRSTRRLSPTCGATPRRWRG